MKRTRYRVEIANRIHNGRAVGTDYVVTHPNGFILPIRFETRAQAQQHADIQNGQTELCRAAREYRDNEPS